MFRNLINFDYKRNKKEAIGFYIAYMLSSILLISALSIWVVISQRNTTVQETNFFQLGHFVAIAICVTLSMLIVHAKKLYKNFLAMVLVMSSIILSLYMATLLGLIPVAILSTFSKKWKSTLTLKEKSWKTLKL